MRVSFEKMKNEFKRVLIKKGFGEERAEASALLFTQTSCDGVYSHGYVRFPRVIEYIDKGYIDVDAVPSKLEGMGAFEKWDGNIGMGNLNAKFCMDRAIGLAKTNAIGCVALKNTNHWMRGGSYGWQAADAGCIGICWTNTLPNMPTWGAKESRIGNNPLILAVPKVDGHVVVDMAMAQFSYGKIEVTKMNNEQLPVPGGYDSLGNITRDPGEIEKTGRVLPIGYWKGSGLSILLDLIVTILSGGNSSYKVGKIDGIAEYKLSQIFIAIDPSKANDSEFIKTAVNEVIKDIKASERADENREIFYPGERTLNTRNKNLEEGIPVDEKIWRAIENM
ncbi:MULTISPECIES: 3-dehydro-L-gulonate 2-dehydrogenase [Clostridium]|uniref:3-dehydro-L-gulonate 2-dehydrogenase n=1 Tax=Clostridium frigoriphilum TaxID=443253 RepID=A0ABU7US54_9CLOT|nr:3-dehydro-L-gulonate 2-dehydrogenase [Clostridium sp. DSM 17811]MBU3101075.1 3-dehydro-L-gulonate 2-dehydrogenase [Clostridium sp. DSM 17811]